MTPVTGTAPAHWAPYLINGDREGLDPIDVRRADAFADWLGARPVSCGELHFFSWSHDAAIASLQHGLGDIGGADCLEFTGLVE